MKKVRALIIFLSLVFITNYQLPITDYRIYAQDASKEDEAIFVARKAFEDGFYDVSRGLLERFLKTYPDSSKIPEAHLLIGETYFYQDRFVEALAKFEELLNSPAARSVRDAVLYWIAEVNFKGRNLQKAIGYYKMVIDEFPKSSYLPAAYYSLGWCLFQEDNFKEALDYFKTVEEKFPREPQAQDASFKIVECLYNLKDYETLQGRIKSYLKIYSKDPVKTGYLNFYLAESNYYLNRFPEAINGYLKVLSGAPDNKVQMLSKLGMGWAYLKLKKFKEAEDVFLQLKSDTLDSANSGVFLLGKAILQLETKKFDEAKKTYDELLNLSSDPIVLVQAYLGKADLFYELAEFGEAINTYHEALSRIDTNLVTQEIIDKLHYGLAWAFLKKGEFKAAIEEFQRILKHTGDEVVKVSAMCQIGDAYQDSGDYVKAIETYDAILKEYPNTLYGDYVQYQLGLTLLKTFNYDGAIMAFHGLKKNFPDSKLLDDAYYTLGLAYFQKEDYASSSEVFKRFQDEFKSSNLGPQAIYLLGTSLYNLGKFTEAIEVFKNIIRMYGNEQELVQKAEYEIADCYDQMGNEKEAMARFKALRSKYPDSQLTAEVMWWLGEYYYKHNDLNLARRYFSSLIRDFSNSNLVASAYYALGSISNEESKYNEAISNFKRVTELDNSDLAGTAAIAIGSIYAAEGQYDLAIETYRRVAQERSNLVHLIYPKLAQAYLKLQRYDEALDFYQKALEVVPVRQMSDIQFAIAETRETQGRFAEAIEEYLKVTYLYHENKELTVKSLLRVAEIYEESRKYDEAVNVYKKVIALGTEEAKYARERIEWIRKNVRR